jgi:hypothetical protein
VCEAFSQDATGRSIEKLCCRAPFCFCGVAGTGCASITYGTAPARVDDFEGEGEGDGGGETALLTPDSRLPTSDGLPANREIGVPIFRAFEIESSNDAYARKILLWYR